jgi:16S rRNA pseudouridine516 synthase
MRLDRFICRSTTLSRQQAEHVIIAGSVAVNGNTETDSATQVHEDNRICLSGKLLTMRPARYLMIHKPADTVCSNIDDTYPSIMNAIDVDNKADLHIAGRLDADTTGLVLVTDDGRWSFAISHPQYHCHKTYRVRLRDPIDSEAIITLQQGIQLQGESEKTKPARLTRVHQREVLLTITEGKYHQVKRMFAAVGNRVIGLHREQIGALKLDIECGQWRNLSAAEADSFYAGNGDKQ